MKKEEVLSINEVANYEDGSASSDVRSVLNCSPEEFCKKYEAYKKAEAEFKEIYEPFKAGLIELYKKEDSNLPKNIIIGGVKTVYVEPSTRTSIDSKKLKEEEPELAKKYTKVSNVDATIRIEGI